LEILVQQGPLDLPVPLERLVLLVQTDQPVQLVWWEELAWQVWLVALVRLVLPVQVGVLVPQDSKVLPALWGQPEQPAQLATLVPQE